MKRLMVTLLVGALLSGFAASPASAAPPTANAVVVPAAGAAIYGKGFGHGKGMSQYGAYGAALAGRNSVQILAFYYPGSRISWIGNVPMRVRLTALDGGVMAFSPVGGARAIVGMVATGGNGRAVRLPAAARWRVAPSRGVFAVQRPVGGVWGTFALLPAPVSITGPPVLQADFGRRKGDCKNSYQALFAGTARAVLYNGRAYYQAVVPIESYLRGVLSSEMPATWPVHAVRAQAIAARTYAFWARTRGFFYDVRDDTGDQCWDGAAAEHPATTAAVQLTKGAIASYGGRPILAQFSASNGGWTAAGGAPYLTAHADPYEARARSPYLAWSARVTPQRLAGLDGPGGLARATNVTVLRRDGRGAWGGRVLLIRISGVTAAGRPTYATISGDAFRRALGLRTNYFGFVAG